MTVSEVLNHRIDDSIPNLARHEDSRRHIIMEMGLKAVSREKIQTSSESLIVNLCNKEISFNQSRSILHLNIEISLLLGMSIVCLEPPMPSDLKHQTLPVRSPLLGSPIASNSLHSSGDQEQWFSHAQQLDPGLGTLSYLPFEIRQMIFSHTLFCDSISGADGMWEYDQRLGSPLNVSTYFFDGCHRAAIDPRIGGLRQASSSIKAEFEDVLLSKRIFRFNDPENLMTFIEQLDKSQLDRVLSVSIGICLLYRVEDWLKAVAQLPSNLTEVQFKIYTAFNDYVQPASLNILKDVMYEAARHVSKAKISVSGSGQEPLTQDCQNLVDEFVQSQSQNPRPR